MLFTLEAVQARHGDCLILHFGSAEKPRFILIDGGPRRVYHPFLKKRLLQIKNKWAKEDSLPLELLMVSHIDEDHIFGVLEMTEELAQLDVTETPPYSIANLWHNSFDDLIGNTDPGLVVAAVPDNIVAAAPAGLHGEALVLASVAQGQELRVNARRLNLLVNDGFGTLVKTPSKVVRFGDLAITVLGPRADRLEALQKEWDKKLKQLAAKKKTAEPLAIEPDESPFNLSSIACHAHVNGKTMLLTGDALLSDVHDGLQAAGLLKNGALHVNLLKMPHHGSIRNVTEDTLAKITADHYVISADGRDDNPDLPTLQMLSKVRGNAEFAIHLTNHDGENKLRAKLDRFFDAEKASGKKYRVVYRDDDKLSMRIDLLKAVNY